MHDTSLIVCCAAFGSQTEPDLRALASRVRRAVERHVGTVPTRLVEPSQAGKLHAAAEADGAGASALRHVRQQVLMLGNLEHRYVPFACGGGAPAYGTGLAPRGTRLPGSPPLASLIVRLMYVPCSGLLSDKHVFVEMGCGKARLSLAVSTVLPAVKLVLVDRARNRNKVRWSPTHGATSVVLGVCMCVWRR